MSERRQVNIYYLEEFNSPFSISSKVAFVEGCLGAATGFLSRILSALPHDSIGFFTVRTNLDLAAPILEILQ